jgi:hypothetical protein
MSFAHKVLDICRLLTRPLNTFFNKIIFFNIHQAHARFDRTVLTDNPGRKHSFVLGTAVPKKNSVP